MLAAIRPDDWNFPLLPARARRDAAGAAHYRRHVVLAGWRRDSTTLSRLGFWSLLVVAFPACG